MTNRNNVRLALIFMSCIFLFSVVSDKLISWRPPKFNKHHEVEVTEISGAQGLVNNDRQYGHAHLHQKSPSIQPSGAEGSSSSSSSSHNNNGHSKIGKMSMLYGEFSPLYERALAAHQPHNERFGYPFFVLREQTLPGYWSKPGYILQLLLSELSKPESQRLEWLVWIDVDVVLMNPKIPLEIFLPPSTSQNNWTHIHTLVTNDHRGLNNGVFFLRVHPYSVDLMTATLSTPNTRPELPLEFGDQTALMHWLNQPQFRTHAIHVPQRWFNAYAGWRGPLQPPGTSDTKDLFADPLEPPTPGKERPNSIKEGDLLVHHAGHKSLRLQRMKPWIDVSERHLPQWELDLEDTGYLEEIREFWGNDAKDEKKNVDKLNKKLEEQRKKKMAKEAAAAAAAQEEDAKKKKKVESNA